MFTATLKNKTFTNGALAIEVEFTDGLTTVSETVKPLSYDNLKAWVSNRLTVLNESKEIDTTHTIGEEIVTTTTPTENDITREAWLKNYYKWIKVKETLVDTGIVTEAQPQVSALKTLVQTGLKAEYLNYIS